jgi:transcription termination factor Rho
VSDTDRIETSVAPAAIERAMVIFEKFKERGHAELVQARKALTDHIFGQVAAGQTDEERLVVSGLTHLKSVERMTVAAKR